MAASRPPVGSTAANGRHEGSVAMAPTPDRQRVVRPMVAMFALAVAAWPAAVLIDRQVLRLIVPTNSVPPTHSPALTPDPATVALTTTALVVPMVMLTCRWFGGPSWRSLGLTTAWRATLGHLAVGIGFWLFAVLAGLATADAAGWIRIEARPPPASFAGVLLVQLALVFFLEALPTELIFRGHLMTVLTNTTTRVVALVGQAVVFTLWAFAITLLFGSLGMSDVGAFDPPTAVLYLTFGLTLGMCRLITGSLWMNIGFHLAFSTVVGLYAGGKLGFVRIWQIEPGVLNVVVFWLFPIVLGSLVLLIMWVATRSFNLGTQRLTGHPPVRAYRRRRRDSHPRAVPAR